MSRLTRCTLAGLNVVVALALLSAAAARASIIAVHDGTLEQSSDGRQWKPVSTPVRGRIDGIAYDPARHSEVVSSGAPGACSFTEFNAKRVIARMSATQFQHASRTTMQTNCALHSDAAGGVLISAGYGTLGSAPAGR